MDDQRMERESEVEKRKEKEANRVAVEYSGEQH